MRKFFLLTLKESLDKYQGRMRMKNENRVDRNSFNAARYLSKVLGYADETTVWKFINQSTSKVKFGIEGLSAMCIEMEDPGAIEDLLIEVKEEIEKRRDKRKEQLEEELKAFEQ